MLPLAEEVSDLFQQNAEEDGLTPKLRKWIERYQVKSWGSLYEDSANYFGLHAGAVVIQDQPLPQFTISPGLSEQETLQSWLDQLWQYIDHLIDDDSDDLEFMDDEEPQVIDELGLGDDGQPITRQQFFMTAALVLVFNYLAFMVHRKSMFQLVAQAKNGTEAAFLKAVQIDQRCLTDIQYFRDKVTTATQTGKIKFLERVAKYQKKPLTQSGTERRALYLALALLDSMHVLSAFTADQEKFAAFCQKEGIYGSS
jgi:hypothetical protein